MEWTKVFNQHLILVKWSRSDGFHSRCIILKLCVEEVDIGISRTVEDCPAKIKVEKRNFTEFLIEKRIATKGIITVYYIQRKAKKVSSAEMQGMILLTEF